MSSVATARADEGVLQRAIATETDPVIAANLRVVAEHIRAEVAGELDALMATLVEQPVYHIWGASTSVGPAGYRAVRANYEHLIRTGKNRLEYLCGVSSRTGAASLPMVSSGSPIPERL